MIYEFGEVGKEGLAINVTKANASIMDKPRRRRMSITALERLFEYGTEAGAALSSRYRGQRFGPYSRRNRGGGDTAQRRDASQLKDQRRS